MKTTTPHTSAKSLWDLTSADLMTIPVRTLPQEMSLCEAARLLTGDTISGAPVVDANGNCVGVLSSSDFVTWAGKDGNGKTIRFLSPWGEGVEVKDGPGDEIRHYVTAKPVTVAPTAPLGELARKMVEAHIHRVLVVDRGRPRGIVTSTDVLAAIARAADQAVLESESDPPQKRRVRH